MMFTNAERQLLTLFETESPSEMIHSLRQALPDIYEPHERTVAVGLITKLEGIGEVALQSALQSISFESEGLCAG